jgi:hypothetical protein
MALIVENRTGANGIVGMQTVYKTLPFDIFRDFAAAANLGRNRVPHFQRSG